MSKNLNPFKIVAIALVVALLSANSTVWGQPPDNPFHDRTVTQVYGLVDFAYPGGVLVTRVTEIGRLVGSLNDPAFGNFPSSHYTRLGNRIVHYVGSRLAPFGGPNCTLPPTYEFSNAVPPTGNIADAANRLWDTVYSAWGYTKVDITASVDPSMNCHGFSTGLNTWIINMGRLVADDYYPTNLLDHLVPGAILVNPNTIFTPVGLSVGSHSARVVEVGDLEENPGGQKFRWIKVVEKNRVSALYEKWFIVTERPDKFCFIQPIILPWGILSEFHVER